MEVKSPCSPWPSLRRLQSLDKWPGRVALVVGGSNDMRAIRACYEWELWNRDIELKTLHTRTERKRGIQVPSMCLLLCTETFFSQNRQTLRKSMDKIIDSCEVHRITEMNHEICGWSEVLVTRDITQSVFRRRQCVPRYFPARDLKELPVSAVEPMAMAEKQSKISWPLCTWIGWRFPTISFAKACSRDDLISLLTAQTSLHTTTEAISYPIWEASWDSQLEFNQLPICHLLNQASSSTRSARSRIICLLGSCVNRLLSSQSLQLIFRDSALVDICEGDAAWLWRVVEAPKFLETFLTAAGRYDVQCSLFALTVQWYKCGRNGHQQLKNLAGQSLADFDKHVLQRVRLQSRGLVDWLVLQLVKLAEKLVGKALAMAGLAEKEIWGIDAFAMGVLSTLRSQMCSAVQVEDKRLAWKCQGFRSPLHVDERNRIC
eukprot:639649-Amphidinium_carterae.1